MDNEGKQLLLEWLTWWRNEETAPTKMPDALHVRTVVFLIAHGDDELREKVNEVVEGPKD